MNFFNSIKNLDFFSFKNNLTRTNISSTMDGLNPLEYLFVNFKEEDNHHIALLIAQELINNGVDRVPVVQNYSEETFASYKKRLYEYIKNSNKFESNLQQSETNVSEYSQQEYIQLKNYAKKFGINANERHLALRIINYLVKLKTCSNCKE